MVKLKVIGKFVHKIDNFLLISVISLIKVLQIHLYHSYMIMIYLSFYNLMYHDQLEIERCNPTKSNYYATWVRWLKAILW